VIAVICNFSGLNRGYMCNYCMQRAAIPACNNCRLSNVFESIHEAKVLQPMTAFGRITWRSTRVDLHAM